jgi:hypothetical protein
MMRAEGRTTSTRARCAVRAPPTARATRAARCATRPRAAACPVRPPTDRCPSGQYCTADNACAAGCRDDAACMAGDGGHGRSLRHRHASVRAVRHQRALRRGHPLRGQRVRHGLQHRAPLPVGSDLLRQRLRRHAKLNIAVVRRLRQPLRRAQRHGRVHATACAPSAHAPHPSPTATTWPGNGCETNTQTDTAHCGGCGMACATRPNATASCAGGRVHVHLRGGLRRLRQRPEQRLRGQPQHRPQPLRRVLDAPATSPTRRRPARWASAPSPMCAAGFGDCDGNAANGCETDTRTSVSHCGACGTGVHGRRQRRARVRGGHAAPHLHRGLRRLRRQRQPTAARPTPRTTPSALRRLRPSASSTWRLPRCAW